MKNKFVIVTISKKQNINGVIRWKRHRELINPDNRDNRKMEKSGIQ